MATEIGVRMAHSLVHAELAAIAGAIGPNASMLRAVDYQSPTSAVRRTGRDRRWKSEGSLGWRASPARFRTIVLLNDTPAGKQAIAQRARKTSVGKSRSRCEGTPSQNTTLIEDGVLVGFMQDRQNARLMGMKPTSTPSSISVVLCEGVPSHRLRDFPAEVFLARCAITC